MPTETIQQLRERIELLERENATLREAVTETNNPTLERDGSIPATTSAPGTKRRWGRPTLAVVLIVLGALLAPVALAANWARAELTSTETFVATLAPLAEDPAVQAFLVDEVVAVVDEHVDVDALTQGVIDGIEELGLGERAVALLQLMQGPAANAVQSLIRSTIENFVESPQFAELWQQVLQRSHRQLNATMTGDAEAVVTIGAGGEIGVQLGPIVESVKSALVARGFDLASSIPEVDRTIVVAQSDDVVMLRTLYSLVVGLGIWLPWVMLALLAAAVVVARRRMLTLVWAAAALAISMLLTLAAIAVVKPIVVASLSATVPTPAGTAILDQLLAGIRDTAVAVTVLAVTVALVGWLAGPFTLPRRLRAATVSAFTRVRDAADRRGLGTGAVGVWLYRQRVLLRALVAIGASAIVLFVRPLSPPLIIWTAVIAVLLIAILELLARPTTPPVEDAEDTEDTKDTEDTQRVTV